MLSVQGYCGPKVNEDLEPWSAHVRHPDICCGIAKAARSNLIGRISDMWFFLRPWPGNQVTFPSVQGKGALLITRILLKHPGLTKCGVAVIRTRTIGRTCQGNSGQNTLQN